MSFDINHPKYSIPVYYLSQVLVAVLGLVVPVLVLKFQGADFWAVVAFFNALQAWFQLIDLGLGSALSRACALCQQPIQYFEQAPNIRRGEKILLVLGVCLAIISAWPLIDIYPEWFSGELTVNSFLCGSLMMMMMALLSRNQLEYYRAILVGCRQLGWLAGVILVMTLLRVAALLFLIEWGQLTLPIFFGVTLVFNLVELVFSRARLWGLLGNQSSANAVTNERVTLPWKFSLSMAMASLFWIVFSQSDKLYLSRALSPHDFAHFSVAAMLAAGIFIIMGPVQNIIATRLSSLLAADQEDLLIRAYQQATHWVCLLIFPICAVFAFRANEILWVWTGDQSLAKHATVTLVGYALGNGLIAISGLVFYLQFALGRLRWHLCGAVLFLMALLPSMKYSVEALGFDGPGIVWFSINLLYFLVWLPGVHRRLLNYSYFVWLSRDVLPIAIAAFSICFVFACFELSSSRVLIVVRLFFEYLFCFAVSMVVSRDGRALAKNVWFTFKRIFEKA